MADYKDYTVHDFLDDEIFFDWVINPTNESSQFWRDFLKRYPHKTDEFNKSKFIVKHFMPMEKRLSDMEIDELWNKISQSTVSRKFQKKRLVYLAAACVIVVIVVSALLFLVSPGTNREINYASFKAMIHVSDDTRLILTDSTELKISESESALKYDTDGKLLVNSQLLNLKKNKSKKGELAFNQLIVPRGKRSSILFSDGTKLWLNSGSRAIYPVEFELQKREIYIEGEAYLEVSPNKNRPFIVKTNQMDVRVLGTSFNISAYPEDKITSVVLVKGSVMASFKSHKERMVQPNQMISYNLKNNKVELQKVDVFEHISWKEGWLVCNSEKLDKVFGKLSRYYNREIRFTDEKAKAFQLSGKLDLKDDFDLVLHVISTTAPVRIEVINNQINISSK